MNSPRLHAWLVHPQASRASSARLPAGFTMLEVVAATAVTAMALATIMPLFARQLRLVGETRRERLALEELANQAERLAAVSSTNLDAAVAAVDLSPELRDLLPGARLTAARAGASPLGEAVVLSLGWDAPGRHERPLSLATWLPPLAAPEEAR